MLLDTILEYPGSLLTFLLTRRRCRNLLLEQADAALKLVDSLFLIRDCRLLALDHFSQWRQQLGLGGEVCDSFDCGDEYLDVVPGNVFLEPANERLHGRAS